MMAINALALDFMLPALSRIGQVLLAPKPNGQQAILTAYLIGGGIATLVIGPLSDRFGRRPVIIAGLSIYTLFAMMGALAPSFEFMIITRFIQGAGAAAPRVLVAAIVRDRYAGREMARIMSLTTMILLVVPILAPSIGQALLLLLSWRGLFVALAVFGAGILSCIYFDLPETLHPEDRRSFSFSSLMAALRIVVTSRHTVGYIFAQTCALGTIFGLVTSAQQVFVDVFHAGIFFPMIFAGIGGVMALAALLNARIVGRMGMRKVSHSGMLGFLAVGLIHVVVVYVTNETVAVFFVFEALTMFCVGLISANFNAMAMEPMGHIAGTASSVQGFLTTVGAGLLGFAVGQNFADSTNALVVGNLLCAGAIVIIVLLTEGRLFRPTIASASTNS